MAQSVLMTQDLFNKIVNNLTQRPYHEVHNLIDEIRSTVQVVETDSAEKEDTSGEVDGG